METQLNPREKYAKTRLHNSGIQKAKEITSQNTLESCEYDCNHINMGFKHRALDDMDDVFETGSKNKLVAKGKTFS